MQKVYLFHKITWYYRPETIKYEEPTLSQKYSDAQDDRRQLGLQSHKLYVVKKTEKSS